MVWDESNEVHMTETIAPTSDRMFEDIRYKSLCIETYMVKQVYSPPTSLFISAETFIGKQKNDKFRTWYERRHDILCANRPLTGVTMTFSRSFVRVTGVSISQGEFTYPRHDKSVYVWFECQAILGCVPKLQHLFTPALI